MKKITKFTLAASAVFLTAKGLDIRLQTTHYAVSSGKIPDEFNNFKIAHISDYHNDPKSGLISKIKRERPDIIAITGDLTDDEQNTSYLPAIELIKKLTKIAPCYIVSGNHDIWRNDYKDFVDDCRKYGAVVLQNEQQYIEKENSRIIISGMEDAFTKVRSKSVISKNLKNFTITSDYHIFLFHRANALDCVKDFGFDLILSGHLHGGQIRLPFIGGICSPLSSAGENSNIFFPKYSGGEYTSDDTKIIVSRGIGNPMILPRFFNRPELGIITLISKNN